MFAPVPSDVMGHVLTYMEVHTIIEFSNLFRAEAIHSPRNVLVAPLPRPVNKMIVFQTADGRHGPPFGAQMFPDVFSLAIYDYSLCTSENVEEVLKDVAEHMPGLQTLTISCNELQLQRVLPALQTLVHLRLFRVECDKCAFSDSHIETLQALSPGLRVQYKNRWETFDCRRDGMFQQLPSTLSQDPWP